MENENQKNAQAANKEQLKKMQVDIKTAFKAGNFDEVKAQAQKIKAIDPKNSLADKLVAKADALKNKQEAKDKVVKIKEYQTMLKKLLKEKDAEKLRALAKELQEFAPEDKTVEKWMKKADKLEGKKAVKKEGKKDERAEAKPELKKEAEKPEAKEKKKGFFSKLFGKKEKKEAVKLGAIPKMPESKEEKPEPAKVETPEPAKTEAPAPAVPTPAAPTATAPAAAPTLKPLGQAPATPTPTPTPLKPLTPEAAKPLAPMKPAPVAPTPAPAAPTPMKPAEAVKVDAPKPEAPKVDAPKAKENTFTKMFGGSAAGSKDKKSIIDRIVAKTDKKAVSEDEKGKEAKPKKAIAAITKIKREEKPGHLLGFSKAFMNLTAVFIVLSGAFLYVEFLDKDNTLMGFVGMEANTGSRLHNATEEVSDKKKEEAVLNKNIELYKGGYDDKALTTVTTIIEERIDWPVIFAKIDEVTNSVYELNDFFKYIEYNNYSFDAEKGAIRVTGTLSDPLGRNLTRLVELEEAFKYYPQDKDNPDDPTQPYFSGFREFTSFSKSLDAETGRYTSSFQLSFTLNK